MRYLATVFQTGAPDAPDPPPDPAIAAEKARRESIAIAQADATRRTRFGTTGTILTGPEREGTGMSRPTETILTADPQGVAESTGVARTEALEAAALSKRQNIDGLGGAIDAAKTSAAAREAREGTSQADVATVDAARSDRNIAEFVNRNRSRLGVRSTR